ncbi:MAG: hypothetical protein M3Q15_05665 [Pseudomonadota bacterium]|nr:hypothetical protein [Pseudomonadota bacterium]
MASMMEGVMRPEDDSGTKAERSRSRKWWTVMALVAASGFAAGAIDGTVSTTDGGFMQGALPGWLAIAIAISYLVSIVVGTIAYKRYSDELDIQANIWGSAVGASALLLTYPVWWILWRGQLVGEPVHETLFLLMFGSALLGYLWKKYR